VQDARDLDVMRRLHSGAEMPDDVRHLPPIVAPEVRRRARRLGVSLPERAWPAAVRALIAIAMHERAATRPSSRPVAPSRGRVAPRPPAKPSRAPRRRRSATRAAKAAATADPEPAGRWPAEPGQQQTDHPTKRPAEETADSLAGAACVNGRRMPGLRHIGDVIADLLPRLSREWGRS